MVRMESSERMNKITEKDQDYVETIQDVNVSTTKVKVIKSKPNEL